LLALTTRNLAEHNRQQAELRAAQERGRLEKLGVEMATLGMGMRKTKRAVEDMSPIQRFMAEMRGR
jgi:hypothetical protein